MPCQYLKGVGPQVAKILAKLGIETLQDLLFHLPYRYQDRTRITPMAYVRAGDYTVIEGCVYDAKIAYGRRRMMICRINDGSGSMTLRFFHFNSQQLQNLQNQPRIRCFGEIRLGPTGIEMVHPEYRFITEEQPSLMEETLTPLYPSTEGIQQYRLRRFAEQALELLNDNGALTELLPDEILQQLNLPDLVTAINFIHRPPPDVDQKLLEEGKHPCQRRLAFEELLAHHLSLRKLRANL